MNAATNATTTKATRTVIRLSISTNAVGFDAGFLQCSDHEGGNLAEVSFEKALEQIRVHRDCPLLAREQIELFQRGGMHMSHVAVDAVRLDVAQTTALLAVRLNDLGVPLA